jgi:hypothetical protein
MHTKRCEVVGHLVCGSKIDNRPLRENHNEIEQAENVTAGLVERAYHLP